VYTLLLSTLEIKISFKKIIYTKVKKKYSENKRVLPGWLRPHLPVPIPPYLAHQPAVTLGLIVILRYQHGVDNARYPKANGKDDAQYKGTDAPGCQNRGRWKQEAQKISHSIH